MSVVQGETYRLALSARCGDGFQGPLTVVVERSDGSDLAQGRGVAGLTEQSILARLKATATDPKARPGHRGQGHGLARHGVALPGEDLEGRNGLRPDLGEMLAGLKPAFVRFPGGCWVEGDTMDQAYRWKTDHRRPRRAPHRYGTSGGTTPPTASGYHEYLQMCEDLGAEPLFVINCGMSHKEDVPMDQMGEWVQDALDAIEYANGPADSNWGGLRAKDGHPAPFNLKYMEIGNENGGPAYHERYALFYDAIKAQYPEMHAHRQLERHPTSGPSRSSTSTTTPTPSSSCSRPTSTTTTTATGRRSTSANTPSPRAAARATCAAAIGEAAFMTGMERNSDVVVMASYAPLFVNVNYKRWNPDLINFDSSRVYGMPSYYVQKMFSREPRRRRAARRRWTRRPWTARPTPGAGRHRRRHLGHAGRVQGHQGHARRQDALRLRLRRRHQGLEAARRRLEGPGRASCARTARADNVRAIAGDKTWTDYTYSLKARKLGGAEGFLILFRVQDENAKAWWNIGGWGNTTPRHRDGRHRRPATCPARSRPAAGTTSASRLSGSRRSTATSTAS